MQKRASNLELLRIVAMLLIVLSHCSTHGIGNDLPEGCINPLTFIDYSGNLGVNLFVFITGYFMVKSEFSLARLLKLLLQVFICSVLLYVYECAVVHPQQELSLDTLKQVCMPIKFYQWWFVTTYVQLFLLAPFLNVFLTRSSPRKVLSFISAGLLIMLYFRTHQFPLLLFVVLYSMAAYVRLYLPSVDKISSRTCFIIGGGLMVLFSSILYLYSNPLPGMKLVPIVRLAITSSYSLPVMILGLVLFVGFLRLHVPYNRVINVVAGTTLGIYLIHDCPGLRYYIWRTLLGVHESISTPYTYIHCFLSVMVVFIACSCLEWLRGTLFNKPASLLVECILKSGRRIAERVAFLQK